MGLGKGISLQTLFTNEDWMYTLFIKEDVTFVDRFVCIRKKVAFVDRFHTIENFFFPSFPYSLIPLENKP